VTYSIYIADFMTLASVGCQATPRLELQIRNTRRAHRKYRMRLLAAA